jgi:hypothetical protein
VRRRHRLLVAAGLLAPACSPAPTAHRGREADHSVPPRAEEAASGAEAAGAGPATTSAEAGAAHQEPASAGPVTTTTTTLLVTTTSPLVVKPTTTIRVPLPEDDEPVGDVEWLVRQTFPETPDKAVRVARCESRLQPGAISPDGANWGVMQVNVVHRGLAARMGYSWDQMLQAGPNLAVARAVYDRAGGWGPWSCA